MQLSCIAHIKFPPVDVRIDRQLLYLYCKHSKPRKFFSIVSSKESPVPVIVSTAREAMARRSVEGTVSKCNGGSGGEACGDRDCHTR